LEIQCLMQQCWEMSPKRLLGGGGCPHEQMSLLWEQVRYCKNRSVMKVSSPLHLSFFLFPCFTFYLPPWDDKTWLPSSNVSTMLLDFLGFRTMIQINFFYLKITWPVIFCYSNTKWTTKDTLCPYVANACQEVLCTYESNGTVYVA
jgi:hypothetical protein